MNRNDILRDFPLAVALLQAEEGFRATPYRCSENKLTIGYGYNITAHGHTEAEAASWVWTPDQAQAALLDELLDVMAALDARYPRWRDLLNADRKAVVLSAVYQLGTGGAAKFVNTISRIKAEDWDGAAAGIMASRWARQTPERAERNAEAMRTGKLPEVVNGVRLVADQVQVVAPAPAQPAAPVLPADRLPDQSGDGSTMGDALGAVGVPSAGSVTVGGVTLSKKLCVAIVGLLAILLNSPLHLGMTSTDVRDLITLLSSYLVGQSAVDAFRPLLLSLLRGGRNA